LNLFTGFLIFILCRISEHFYFADCFTLDVMLSYRCSIIKNVAETGELMIGILFVFDLLLFVYLTFKVTKEGDIVKNIVFSQMFFWCTYVLCSAALFLIDCFSILLAMVIVTIFGLACVGYCHWKRKEPLPSVCFDRKYLYVIIVCLLGILLQKDKFELYGMSQDEGVYQTQAISFIYGNNKNQKDLEEFHELDEQAQEKYLAKMEQIIAGGMHGYYYFNEKATPRNYQERISEVSGYYHGVPTYAAQMALVGSVFGIENMIHIQTLFWCLCVFLLYLVLRRFCISLWAQYVLVTVYAFTPIMTWLSKTSLTEMFLTCLMNLFLYYVLDDEKPNWLMIALPMVTYAFVHLSFYTLLPILCVCKVM